MQLKGPNNAYIYNASYIYRVVFSLNQHFFTFAKFWHHIAPLLI